VKHGVERHRKSKVVVLDSDSDEDTLPSQIKKRKGNCEVSGKCYCALENCLGDGGILSGLTAG
jgi:hypothetical protein